MYTCVCVLCMHCVHVKRTLSPCSPLTGPVSDSADKREKTAKKLKIDHIAMGFAPRLGSYAISRSPLNDPCKGRSSFRSVGKTKTLRERKKSQGTVCSFKPCPVCTVRFSGSIQSLTHASSVSVLITYLFYYTFILSLPPSLPSLSVFLPCLLSMHSLLSLPHFDIFICPAKTPGSLACIHSSLYCLFNTKFLLHKVITLYFFRKFGVCGFWGYMTPQG